MTTDVDRITQRLIAQQIASGHEPNPDLPRDPWSPRWRMEAGWIEFECGCRAERCDTLHGPVAYDPIIFRNLPEQAVYDFVCSRHEAGMNKYVHFGHFVDFGQWRRSRRAILMGKVEH